MMVSWWCLIGQDEIPRRFRGGAHWSERNSTMVSLWCLIGQDVIPRWFHGDASW